MDKNQMQLLPITQRLTHRSLPIVQAAAANAFAERSCCDCLKTLISRKFPGNL